MKKFIIAIMVIMIWAAVFFVNFRLNTNSACADEGMWLPHQIGLLNLETRGLKIDAGSLYKKDGTGLMSAVIKLNRGTAEFVSKDGLLLTNHHVAYTAIQRASDKKNDYLADGFLARTRGEEIPAKGYSATVLLGYRDVTQLVKNALNPVMTPAERLHAVERIKMKLVAQEEAKGEDIYCQVKSMYSGNMYYLFTFKRLWDIRLVYAPPRSIGNFGGEIDNWMWPRHTGDFTFLRAYVSPKNKGVPYSPKNVPYRPKSFLKVSLDGVKPGDFTFVMGYPGTTYRNYSLPELMLDIEKLQVRKRNYKEIVDFFEAAGKNDREVEIRYAAAVKGIHNSIKSYTGKLAGFKQHDITRLKKDVEKKFMDWVNTDTPRKRKYGTILERLRVFMKRYRDFHFKLRRMETMVDRRLGVALLRQGYLVYRVSKAARIPESKREDEYRERNIPAVTAVIKVAERDYHLETDKEYLKLRLQRLLKLERTQWPRVFAKVLSKGKPGISRYVDRLYKRTHLYDPLNRLRLTKVKPSALEMSRDPLMQLSIAFEKEYKTLREKEKTLDQELADLKKVYIAGLLEMSGNRIAPDANKTIRVTYGPVKGYKPRDGVLYLPQTTLSGIIGKDTGKFPFLVPQKLKELYKSRDFGPYADPDLGDIATCFINTTNVTGGSSGSPVLNASGHQVGIIFDMTYESVMGDYYILPQYQRTIGVDIRYVLFITGKMAGARHLLEEMGL